MDRIKEKRELKAINPMLFLVAIIVIVAIASYIVPAGSYDRVYDAVADRNVVDPGSYHLVDKNPISIFSLLMSVTLGMQNAAYIIFFLLIIGGMFAILNGTGAINAGMSNVVRAMRGKELLMIPVCMVVFGCGSAFCANFEEFLAFVPLVLACCLTMGFDSLTAVGIIFCAAASGYAGAVTNAFTTGVAQSIAGLPMFSGMGLRVAVFVVLLAVSITYVMWHARRVKRDPHLSSTYEIDRITAQNVALDVDNVERLNGRQKLVLVVFIAGIAFTVWGIVTQGYYIDELAAIFLAIGIIGGVIGGLRPSEICDHFEKGCVNMLFPCLMVGLANAVIILLQEASIMDPIIHYLSGLLNGLPPTMAACGMFVVQDLFNVLVPSGSGQAAITMPIMAPLADMLNITRQTSVLAFQMGDAFTNVMAPTGGEILAALAMCGGVPFKKWMKYLLPLFIAWWVVAFVFLSIAVQIGYGPF
ncbi:MAG: YfcC family protein [Oscillibacter ruminantium]|uniref:YfcC family protein n=1 Tax=Oscillibacter ruminantium TaxID=1263547 RepID=UPI002B1E907A|nr:YfcC family protein [Oscillibacter ruminantium]MEA5042896.1 YfcC family protein [Oscillibacter ruminantium]